MTRLVTEDIRDLAARLPEFDDELIKKTGLTLRQLACHAVDIAEDLVLVNIGSRPAAVVPVTGGQGIIDNFSETVAVLLRHLGLDGYVTAASDTEGVAQAYEAGAQMIFMADDSRFICLQPGVPQMIDNNWATARGFSTALDLMYRGVNQQGVLVVGCGSLGAGAAGMLVRMGADVSLYDLDPAKAKALADALRREGLPVTVRSDLQDAMLDCRLVLEATNSGGVIDIEHLQRDTFIAAPGMPFGLTPAAALQISRRVLHDPLQIGVAVMALEGVKQMMEREEGGGHE